MNPVAVFSNNMPPKLSIALPVLNGGKFLQFAVNSLLNQSFLDWELLLIDDGSTDNAVDYIQKIFDPRINIIRNIETRGLSVCLNQAINLARGKYLARMDHDDICHPHRFAKQVEFLEKNKNIDLLATQCIRIDEHDNIVGVLRVGESHEQLCSRPWIAIPMAHPTWMGRIEWFRKNPYMYPVPYCCDDNELLLRAHSYSHYHCLPEQLLAYRVRTHTSWQKRWKTRVAQLKVQTSYFKNHRRWGEFFLSFIVALARVIKDIFEELKNSKFIINAKSEIRIVNSQEFLAWNEVIKNIKKSIDFNKSIDSK